MRRITLMLIFGLLLLTGSALAQNELGSVLLQSLPSNNDPSIATVNCLTIQACTFTGPDGADHEAVKFSVLTQQNVHLDAVYYQNVDDCSAGGQPLSGDFPLTPGDWIIYLIDPQTDGSSATWTVGICPPTDCSAYPAPPC